MLFLNWLSTQNLNLTLDAQTNKQTNVRETGRDNEQAFWDMHFLLLNRRCWAFCAHVDASFLHCIISVLPYGTVVSGGCRAAADTLNWMHTVCLESFSLNVNNPLLCETIYYLKRQNQNLFGICSPTCGNSVCIFTLMLLQTRTTFLFFSWKTRFKRSYNVQLLQAFCK